MPAGNHQLVKVGRVNWEDLQGTLIDAEDIFNHDGADIDTAWQHFLQR